MGTSKHGHDGIEYIIAEYEDMLGNAILDELDTEYMLQDFIKVLKYANEEIDQLTKALAKMKFAYLNKDRDIPHEFEKDAIKLTNPLIEKYGGMEELLKEKDNAEEK